MIKKLIVLALAISVFSCKTETKKVTDGYLISATIDPSANNKVATIFKMDNRARKVIATDTVTNGKIEFVGKIDSPESHFLTVDGVRGSLPFILENAAMTMTLYKDSIGKSKISGSIENKLTAEYQQHSLNMRKTGKMLQNRYRKAQEEKDNKEISAVRRSYDSLRKAGKAFDVNFISENTNTVIAAITLQRLLSSRSINADEALGFFNKLSDNVKASNSGLAIKRLIDTEKATAVGSVAPNFTGKTPEGKDLSLKDIKSKVTIIDFWASWCGPCRKENPNVVKLYNKYHKKGLEIIGVSLDKQGQKQRWVDAIKKDQLTWPQVSNLQGWRDPIATQYNVRSIPRTFVLDENGKIIAANLRGEFLEKKIAELLD